MKLTLLEALTTLELTSEEITLRDVKASYRAMVLIWHPDFHVGEQNIHAANERTKIINAAYEMLVITLDTCDIIRNPHFRTQGNNSTHHQQDAKSYHEAPEPRSRYSSKRRSWRDAVLHGFPDHSVVEIFFVSSHIVSGGYSATSRILYLKFLNSNQTTAIYRYLNVPSELWHALLRAPSQGRFASRYILYSFRYERCS